ncbi:MAG: hypothetical protein Q8R90_04945 [Bacteroidales bacterium]|nr:hypothetical protein [Bacteroidales bacterium]
MITNYNMSADTMSFQRVIFRGSPSLTRYYFELSYINLFSLIILNLGLLFNILLTFIISIIIITHI